MTASNPPPFEGSAWNSRSIGLLVACSLAGFGAWIDFLVILTMAAYVYEADGITMALVSTLFLAPAIALGAKVGRWVDTTNPGQVIGAALLLRACATGMLMMQPSLVMFCVWVLLRSTLTIPVDPAFNLAVSRVVSKVHVPRYFAVLGLVRNVSKISAPVIGTTVASLYGDSLALAISIALTAIALVTITVWVGLKTPERQTGSGEAIRANPSIATGETDQAVKDLIKQFLTTVTIFAFVVFFVNNQLAVLLRDAGYDKQLLGVLISCSGAGGILAAMYMTKTNAAVLAKDPMTATTISVFATSLSFVALGLAFLLPMKLAPFAAAAVFFCTGVFATIEAIRSGTVIVQNFAANVGEISGRVQSYTSAAMLIAPWLAAVVIPYLSLPTLLIVDGLLGASVLLLVLVKYRTSSATRRAVAS